MAAMQCILESPFRWILKTGAKFSRRVMSRIRSHRDATESRYEPNG
ncbi:hypothetical protein ACQQ2Q_12585 [Agrobacterium sp. ES01]